MSDMSKHIFVIPMVLSMTTLYSLGQNAKNEVKQDFASYVMPLVLAMLSCDANYIKNGIICSLIKTMCDMTL